MNLIECFSYVHGHKYAIDLVTDLNAIKTSELSEFYIEYDKNQDYNKNDSYLIKGNVTEKDWDELDLESDFMLV